MRVRGVWLVAAVCLCLGVSSQAVAQSPAVSSAVVETSPVSAVVDLPAEAEKALVARSPVTVEDLRLIQAQLQRVVAKVMPATAAVQVGRAIGSAVIVSKDGYVLTAAHVVSRPGRQAWVTLADGRRLPGQTLGADHDLDAGLIKLDNPPADLAFAPMCEQKLLEPGEWVVTLGQPGGLQPGRDAPVRLGRVLFRDDRIICTDCKLVGGDSGGPLFNMRGEVVGIHSSIGPALTHNFHVPVSAFRDDWKRLVAGELWGGRYEVGRPVIGVTGREQDGRCLITQAFAGMPADEAGVKQGDAVLAIDGRSIDTFDELARIVAFKSPGDVIRLSIDRGGESMEIEVTLAAAEDE